MLILKTMDDAQASVLYETCMRRDFPPSELKSLSAILKMKRRGLYNVLGAYQTDGCTIPQAGASPCWITWLWNRLYDMRVWAACC